MPPQRRVRQRPLWDRITANLHPLDFLLWLSEEIETRDLNSKAIGTQIGLAASFLFMLARANTGSWGSSSDDVFGDGAGSGWLAYVVFLVVWSLAALSMLNAFYAFWRTRRYRLFEANVEVGPGTPSAHRVRVQSNPASSSPLRLLTDALSSETAESRAYPDSTRDVWELAIWDPTPLSLQILAIFSPLHVMIYLFELPLTSMDARPSVTLFKCLVLQAGLSGVLLLLHSKNEQKAKDTAIIQKEVFHEYDTKYVHPRLHPVVRDVAIQTDMATGTEDEDESSILSGTPTTIIRRTFETHPNPNYLKHIDPDSGDSGAQLARRESPRPTHHYPKHTPLAKPRQSEPVSSMRPQTSSRKSLPATAHASYTTSSASPGPTLDPGTGNYNFGGNLGILTHVNSPLKKATSLNDMNGNFQSPRNNREMAALEQREQVERIQRQHEERMRSVSPVKEDRARESRTPAMSAMSRRSLQQTATQSPPAFPNPFVRNANRSSDRNERFPSRW